MVSSTCLHLLRLRSPPFARLPPALLRPPSVLDSVSPVTAHLPFILFSHRYIMIPMIATDPTFSFFSFAAASFCFALLRMHRLPHICLCLPDATFAPGFARPPLRRPLPVYVTDHLSHYATIISMPFHHYYHTLVKRLPMNSPRCHLHWSHISSLCHHLPARRLCLPPAHRPIPAPPDSVALFASSPCHAFAAVIVR